MSDATLADLRRWNTDFPPVGDYRWAPATVDDLIAALQAEGVLTPLYKMGGLVPAFYEDTIDEHDGYYWLLEKESAR